MYDNEKVRALFGLTADEVLFEKLSIRRVRRLIGQALTHENGIRVIEAEVDSNSYGEWLFVRWQVEDSDGKTWTLTGFGLGQHEYTLRWNTDHFSLYADGSSRKRDAIPAMQVECSLTEREADVKRWAAEDQERSRAQNHYAYLWELLSEIGDEDGTWSELSDLAPEDLFPEARQEDEQQIPIFNWVTLRVLVGGPAVQVLKPRRAATRPYPPRRAATLRVRGFNGARRAMRSAD